MKVLWNSIIYNLSYILEMEAEYNFLAKFLVKTLLIPMRGGGRFDSRGVIRNLEGPYSGGNLSMKKDLLVHIYTIDKI